MNKKDLKNLIGEHKEIVKDLQGAKKQHDMQAEELQELYDQYRKIKGMSDGGKVEHNKKNLVSLKKAFDKFIQEEGKEPKGYAYGGPITRDLGELEGSTIIGSNPLDLEEAEQQPTVDQEAIEKPYPNEEFVANEMAQKTEKLPVETDNYSTDELDKEETEDKPEDLEKDTEDLADEKPSEDKLDQTDDESSLQRLLASVKSSQQTNKDLREAQRQRQSNINFQQMQKYAALAGAGIAGANPEQQLKIISAGDQYVDLPVKEYNEQIANQKDDPNSQMSGIMKDYLRNKGINVSDKASASDLFKLAPYLQKDAALQAQLQKVLIQQKVKQDEAEKNRQLKEKLGQLTAKEKARMTAAYEERTKMQAGGANDRKMQTRFDQISKALREGGGQPIVQNRLAVQRANNLFLTNGVDPSLSDKEIDRIPDAKLNKVNRISVIETGMELNRLLTGSGVPAQNTLNKLIPNNANMTTTQIEDYITNNLNPADQAQALRAYMKIAARVRDQSKKNVQAYQKQVLSGAGQILDHFPEQSDLLLAEHELSPSDLKGNKTKPQGQNSGNKTISQAQLSAYAKQHKISEDKARQLLSNGGFQVE